MNILDLPIEILQKITDFLDLQHQIFFKNSCRLTFQLSITNLMNNHNIIKSNRITNEIINLFPNLKKVSLRNNRIVTDISMLKSVRLLNIDNSSVDVNTVKNLHKLKKIVVSKQDIKNLILPNVHVQINYLHYKLCQYGSSDILYLCKHCNDKQNLVILNAMLADTIVTTEMLCTASKYCNSSSSIECVIMLLYSNKNFFDENNSSVRTALKIACLYCSTTSSIECVKLLLKVKDRLSNIVGILNNVCEYFTTETDITCIKMLLKYCGKQKWLNSSNLSDCLIKVCENCNNIYSEQCILLLINYDKKMNIINGTTLKTVILHAKTVWSLRCVKLLINKIDVNTFVCTNENITILNFICSIYCNKKSDVYRDIVKFLVESGSKINYINLRNKTSLLLLLGKQKENKFSHEVVKYVTNSKIINFKNVFGNTALIMATKYCDIITLKYLIDAGANLNIQNNNGSTALMKAVKRYHNKNYCTKHAKLLIDAGADLDIQCANGCTALLIALSECNHDSEIKYIKYLIDAGANLNLQNNRGLSPLVSAILLVRQMHNIECVKMLIDAGADINMLCSCGFTALGVASGKITNEIDIECVKLLLNAKADVDIPNKYGSTVLMIASRNCNNRYYLQVVKMLIDAGSDINSQDEYGNTALMLASRNCDDSYRLQVVKMLIDAGANINIQDEYKYTSLMFASRYCKNSYQTQVVKMLIDAGANKILQDTNGDTALMLAISHCDNDYKLICIKVLIESGIDLNIQDINGQTALILAVRDCTDKYKSDCINMLINAGADINITDKHGKTYLTYAEELLKNETTDSMILE